MTNHLNRHRETNLKSEVDSWWEESFVACAHNKDNNNKKKYDLWWEGGCTYEIMPTDVMSPENSRVASNEFWCNCM